MRQLSGITIDTLADELAAAGIPFSLAEKRTDKRSYATGWGRRRYLAESIIIIDDEDYARVDDVVRRYGETLSRNGPRRQLENAYPNTRYYGTIRARFHRDDVPAGREPWERIHVLAHKL